MCRTSREPVRAMAAASSAVMSSKVRWQPAAPCCWMGGISARPTHTASAPRAKSFKDVHAVLKGAVHKDGDFPPQGFHNLRQDQQRRHRGGHDPVVVGDQNPARPGVQTLLGVLGAEHPLDEEGQLGALAVGGDLRQRLGAHGVPQHVVRLALAVKAVVNVHANGHSAQLLRLLHAGENLSFIRVGLDNSHQRRASFGDFPVLLQAGHAHPGEGSSLGGALGHLHHAIAVLPRDVGEGGRHHRRGKFPAEQLHRGVRHHRVYVPCLHQNPLKIPLRNGVGILRFPPRFHTNNSFPLCPQARFQRFSPWEGRLEHPLHPAQWPPQPLRLRMDLPAKYTAAASKASSSAVKTVPMAPPHTNSRPMWYTAKVITHATAIWNTAVRPTHFQLPVSFLMVASVAAQGTYSREKVIRQ